MDKSEGAQEEEAEEEEETKRMVRVKVKQMSVANVHSWLHCASCYK